MFKDKLMVGKENKKLILGVLLTFIVCIGSAILAAYMTNPQDSNLKYPNPGHYPGEIGPGTFNASDSTDPYWNFPGDLNVSGNTQLGDSSSDKTTVKGDLDLINGTGFFYKGLRIVGNPFSGPDFLVEGDTQLGNDSSDKTTVKGDLDVSGNVGIGTTDVRSLLHVGGTSTSRSILGGRSDVAANTDSPKLSFFGGLATGRDVAGPSIQKINTGWFGRGALAFLQHDADDYTTEAEVMRIMPNGNVGIGTTTPAAKLDVNGSARIQGDLNVSGNGDICLDYCRSTWPSGGISCSDCDTRFVNEGQENSITSGMVDFNYAGSSSEGGAANNAKSCNADGTCEVDNLNVSGNTQLGDSSSDKTTVKGDLNVSGNVTTSEGVVVGNPTGGNKGAGSINAEKVYENGSEVGGLFSECEIVTKKCTDDSSSDEDSRISCEVSCPSDKWLISGGGKCYIGYYNNGYYAGILESHPKSAGKGGTWRVKGFKYHDSPGYYIYAYALCCK